MYQPRYFLSAMPPVGEDKRASADKELRKEMGEKKPRRKMTSAMKAVKDYTTDSATKVGRAVLDGPE